MEPGKDSSLIGYLAGLVPSIPTRAFTEAPEYQPVSAEPKPLSAYPADFPEMRQYQQLASKAFHTARVIRHGDKLLTPAEYLIQMAGEDTDPETAASLSEHLLASVEPYLTGVKIPDQTPASDTAKRVLEKLKAQSVVGNEQVFPGQTLKQREARRTGPMQEGRYMTSEGMDQNLAATRVLNLLSATQADPELSPDTASPTSAVLSGIGAAFAYPLAAFSGGLQGEDNFLGKETIDMAHRRLGTAAVNPLQARIQEAIYQDQKAQEGTDIGQYRSGFQGGFYPHAQWTSGKGMVEQANYDNANLNTMASATVLPQFFSGTPTLGGDDSATFRNLAYNLGREVPVLPEGLSAEEANQAREELREYLDAQERRFHNEYPVTQRAWNDTTIGQLWPAKQYSFPSPMTNTLANSWKYWLDPATIGTLGAGAVVGAARGGGNALIRTLAHGAKDFIRDTATIEVPATAAMYSAQQGMSPSDLFQPMKTSDVTDTEGNPARPDDPNYGFYLGQHEDRQKKRLGRLIEFGKKWYPAPPPQSSSGEGADYTERLSYQ